jgi:arylsulfatase A-like enzyme
MRTPNILICTWHDTGRHFGCYGHATVHSPNVDRLAADGVLFERAHCAAAKCSPSRGALLTGQWPQSNGLYHLCHGVFDWRLRAGTKHAAQLLAERGYHTVLHGFHHEHPHSDTPRLGHAELHNHTQPPPTWQVPPCDVVAGDVAAWLRARPVGEQPFFMQVGFFETHRPYAWGGVTPDREHGVEQPAFLAPCPELEQDMAMLQGSIRKADAAVGVILDALAASGHERDTIVVFTVDHGLDLPGAKGTCYEPGLEIALVVRWPAGGLVGGRRVGHLVSNVDVLPTLFELAGLRPEPGMQGVPFTAACRDPAAAPARDHVYAMIEEGERRSVSDGRWKLIRNFRQLRDPVRPVRLRSPDEPYSTGATLVVGRDVPHVLLFDLHADPNELRNLADDPACADQRQRLDEQLWRWMESVNDPLLALPHDPRWRKHLRDFLNR